MRILMRSRMHPLMSGGQTTVMPPGQATLSHGQNHGLRQNSHQNYRLNYLLSIGRSLCPGLNFGRTHRPGPGQADHESPSRTEHQREGKPVQPPCHPEQRRQAAAQGSPAAIPTRAARPPVAGCRAGSAGRRSARDDGAGTAAGPGLQGGLEEELQRNPGLQPWRGRTERQAIQAATADLLPTPWLRSSLQSCCSTALASPNTIAVCGSSNRALAMPA